MNLPDLWAEVLKGREHIPAVFEPSGAVARTFGDVDREAGEVAASLPVEEPGGVISLQAPNSPSWFAKILGIWKAGGCALLIDASLPESAVLAAERLCGARFRIESERVLPLEKGGDPDSRFAVVKLTSGTTGAPRLLAFRAGELVADCEQICETMGIGASDLNYGLTAFSHSYGFSNLVTPLLCRGVPAVAASDALPRAVAKGLKATSATVFPSVPAIFQALSRIDADFSALRLCISAGAPLPAATVWKFHERFGLKIHSFYGASECGGICYDRSEELPDVDGYVGTPLKGVELEQLDGDGEIGFKVAVGGRAVCRWDFGAGLVDRGWFFPADRLLHHGIGVRIVGRDSDLINVAGRKVNPSHIEGVIRSIDGVEDVVVFGVPDTRRGQAIAAWIVGATDADDIRARCADLLAPWQLPRDLRMVDALPVNARGKISRRDIARLHGT